jgi:hypothetical protein
MFAVVRGSAPNGPVLRKGFPFPIPIVSSGYGPGTEFPVGFSWPKFQMLYWRMKYLKVRSTVSSGDQTTDMVYTIGGSAVYGEGLVSNYAGFDERCLLLQNQATNPITLAAMPCQDGLMFLNGEITPPSFPYNFSAPDSGMEASITQTNIGEAVTPDSEQLTLWLNGAVRDSSGNYYPHLLWQKQVAADGGNIYGNTGSADTGQTFSFLGQTVKVYALVTPPGGFVFPTFTVATDSSPSQFWGHNGFWNTSTGELTR